MSHLSNYPAGAMNDPSAPFAQPDASDECNFEHPDYEECQLAAEFTCACGTECCSEAIVTRRTEWNGRRSEETICPECAERDMVPLNADATIALLNRAVDQSMGVPELSLDDRLDRADIFTRCMGEIAEEVGRERHEASLAILNFGRAA